MSSNYAMKQSTFQLFSLHRIVAHLDNFSIHHWLSVLIILTERRVQQCTTACNALAVNEVIVQCTTTVCVSDKSTCHSDFETHFSSDSSWLYVAMTLSVSVTITISYILSTSGRWKLVKTYWCCKIRWCQQWQDPRYKSLVQNIWKSQLVKKQDTLPLLNREEGRED